MRGNYLDVWFEGLLFYLEPSSLVGREFLDRVFPNGIPCLGWNSTKLEATRTVYEALAGCLSYLA